MKLLGDSYWPAILALLLSFLKPPYANGSEIYSSKIGGANGILEVKIDGNGYYIKNGPNWNLIKISDTPTNKVNPVIFMDANLDGLTDFFVKIFDGRVEGFYSLFLVHPHDKRLLISEQKYIFGNPKMDEHGSLISTEHDGPFSKKTEYRSQGGKIYKSKERTPLSTKIEKVTTYDNTGNTISATMNFLGSDNEACAQVTAEKAFFYEGSIDTKKTNSYLIEGNIARILDITQNGDWLKVSYSGKRKIIGWLHSSQANISDPDTCHSTH